jgi:two-component system, NtrC family, sensor kinase
LKGFFDEFVSAREGLERRLEVDQKDEIGEVYQAFNLMADRLEDLVAQRGFLLQDCNAQQEKISTVFDAITDRLLLLAPDYTILMANTAANGGRKEFREHTTCYSHFYDLDAPCKGCSFEQVLDAKKPILGEMTLGDGETYLSQFYPIMDPQTGEVTSLVHYYKPITEKKRMEQNMMQAEKLASLGQLVAGVAHELNNPLGIILFYSDLLKNEMSDGSEHLDDVKVIEKHGEACKTIVEDLLKFSRTVETRTEKVDVNESVAKVLAVLEKQFAKENVSIEKRFDRNIPRIPLDQTKIQQVWMNVLLNAKQSIKNGGGKIVVNTLRDVTGERVAVIVSDNGEGMSPDIQRMIFDPFFTTKDTGEGTGLGLSVSYGIVKQHGGHIEVSSSPGQGSIFRVWLPERENGTSRDY